MACADLVPARPYWDGASCVEKCPYNRPLPSKNGVCESCEAQTVLKNGKCVPCAQVSAARPVFDEETGQCVSCAAADTGKPLWNGKECTACEVKTEWDPETEQCVAVCGPEEIRVDGKCEPKTVGCANGKVLREGACVSCNETAGEVYSDGKCVCDAAKYLKTASGGCTVCVSALLEYSPAAGRCFCKNGAPPTYQSGKVACEVPCPSGVFSREDLSVCMESCPSSMVLSVVGGRRLCGKCDGYVYFDQAARTTTCVGYEACLAMDMVPRVS